MGDPVGLACKNQHPPEPDARKRCHHAGTPAIVELPRPGENQPAGCRPEHVRATEFFPRQAQGGKQVFRKRTDSHRLAWDAHQHADRASQQNNPAVEERQTPGREGNVVGVSSAMHRKPALRARRGSMERASLVPPSLGASQTRSLTFRIPLHAGRGVSAFDRPAIVEQAP